MSITFDIQLDKRTLRDLEGKIDAAIMNPTTKTKIYQSILGSTAISRWLNFLDSKQFLQDFGIDSGSAASLKNSFLASIKEVSLVRQGHNIFIQALDQDKIRNATMWAWTNSKGNSILVNAWDIYEYGKIGGTSATTIQAYHIVRKQSPLSRSGEAIMSPGKSFRFGTGIAPRIFSVRSSFVTTTERFAHVILSQIGLGGLGGIV